MDIFTVSRMLKHIAVRDFSLLRDVALALDGGLTVLTGESGAGKTLIFDAVAFALGGRPHRSLLASGAASCEVTLTIAMDARLAQRIGKPWQSGENRLVRTLTGGGRSKLTLNGEQITVAEAQRAGELLFEITGQFESRVLFNPASHLALLDAFGDDKLRGALATYRAEYGEHRELAQRLKALREAAGAREQEVDFLRFQTAELSKASVHAGERCEVEAALRLQQHAGQLINAAATAAQLLSSDSEAAGAYDLAAQAQEQLAGITALLQGAEVGGQSADELAAQLAGALASLQDVAGALHELAGSITHDPAELKRLEERLDELNRLERKHGCPADELPQLLEQKQQRLAALTDQTQSPEALAAATEQAAARLDKAGAELSAQRRKAVTLLERTSRGYFKKLDFPHVELKVELAQATQPGPDGADEAEFLISLNPGEPARPLALVASGGEASRLLLGLKAALAERLGHSVMMLDEIEAGVGGGTSQHLAEVLRELAQRRQLIAITHLPIVAAYGAAHLVARKRTEQQRTAVAIEAVSGEARRAELARMLGGAGKEELALVDKLLKAT